MEEFTTSLFKENETKTNNIKVSRERPYYIGLLLVLIGFALGVAESPYTIYFVIAGALFVLVGKITMSGKAPSVGHRPLTLRLTKDSLYIGEERIEIKTKEDLEIVIVGYKGEGITQRSAFYQAHSGNENVLRVKYGRKLTEFRFVLESEVQRDKLLKFCEANGFELGGEVDPCWTR